MLVIISFLVPASLHGELTLHGEGLPPALVFTPFK